MRTRLRYGAGMLLLMGLLTSGACAPSAPPSPTSGPSQASPSAALAAPKAATAPAVSSSATTDWKTDWDKTLAEAKKEGKVVVAGGRGEEYRTAMMTFQKDHPDIELELTGTAIADFGPKLLAEREGGRYLWDILMSGGLPSIAMLRPKGALDPIKPTMMLPEVLDDKAWVGGFDNSWMDKDHQLVFAFGGRLFYMAFVNRDVVPDSGLNSLDQLLDPKWKGKIISADPRVPGSTNGVIHYLLISKGEDWLRKLLAQDLNIVNDERQVVEAVVRQRYPIMLGVSPAAIEPYKHEEAGRNLKPLESETAAGASLSSGFDNMMLLNRAPHPNAAKVFINWLTSQDAQRTYVETTGLNSRRLDVPGPPDYAPRPNVKYVDIGKEETEPYKTRATEIANEIIK